MRPTRSLVFALLLAAALAQCSPQTPSAQSGPSLKPHVAASKLYMLYKPADWKVLEEPEAAGLRIRVQAPDGLSMVDFFWAQAQSRSANALAFLVSYRQRLSRQHGDVAVSEVFVSGDGARATARIRYRAPAGAVSGKYYVESRPGAYSVQGYCAPEARRDAQRSLLLNIMASFAFTKTATASSPRAAAPAPPVQLALTVRRAQDGSLAIRVPADWVFLAGGGRVLTAAPDGAMGFIFTAFSGNPMLPQATVAQGVIGTRYLPPDQALAHVFSGFNNRQFRIHAAEPDRQTIGECAARMGTACDARDFQVSYVSPEDRACVGGFKVIDFPPSPITGMWNCIVAGIWGPEREFARYLPALEQIAGSFTINDEYARRYIQAGLENLRRLQQKTQAAMQDLNQMRAQNQKDWEAAQQRKEYMDSAWDDYRRGRSYWVSELEGGKVYATDSGGTQDTLTGQYYEGRPYNWVNFEGQNPRHPSETMREVTSAEIKKLEGGWR